MKTVLVTGASRGIGRELALAFGRAGYAVGVNYYQGQDQADAVVRDILKDGHGKAEALGCDVRDSLKVRQMMDTVLTRWGRLDVLINNAGINRDRTILKMTNGEWNEVLDTNLSGAFWCLREAARVMSKEKQGAILNIASLMGLRGGFGNANYAAAKAGLMALTKAAARELGRFHIAVNAVLPGFHQTEMAQGIDPANLEKLEKEHVLGHFTTYEDLTRFVVELAQNQSISGQIFNVDSRIV